MNYENLKDAIVAVIKQNGNEEITGNLLQQVLLAMVNSLGSGYQFRGIATPETNPGTPDQRVFYLASATGTYADFGVIVSDEICALVYDTAWHKQTIVVLDQEPTEDSGNLISSGAIYTALQDLADVYMKLVEDADEDHIATFDENGQVKDSGLSLDDVAKAKGSFPELFAGFAGNLVDTRSAGTRQQFAFRQSGGDGVNYMRKILGRTRAWNQKANGISVSGASPVVISNRTTNGFTATAPAGSQNKAVQNSIFSTVGHKYYVSFEYTSNLAFKVQDMNEGDISMAAASNFVRWSKAGFKEYPIYSVLYWYLYATTTEVWTLVVRNYMCVDLTLMFGAGNEPTVAEFEALHPLGYYNYNAGVLKNNAATGLETTGFNQWDEEWENGYYNVTNNGAPFPGTNVRGKNKIPVLGGQTYYGKSSNVYNAKLVILFFDSDDNYLSYVEVQNATFTTPTNCAHIKFYTYLQYGTTYNHDICINISDASRNGIYEPYWKREIVLGLDNLACHDENNNAVVVNGLDGVGTAQDELVVENGWGTKINKNRARVDLGSLEWEYISGANARFKATPSPATVSPGNSNMSPIVCSKYAPDTYTNIYAGTGDKQVGIGGDANIYVRDTAYSDAATFKAAMAGVYLDYPFATPKVLTLDNPIPTLIEVDNLGTEKRLPEDTADNTQGPFESDSNYSISTANLVRKLSEL